MRRLRRFPFTGFERLGRQSDLPGDPMPRVPFDPSKQPDIRAPYRTDYSPSLTDNEAGGAGAPTPMSDVRHVFDSRPLMAYDFYWEDFFEDGIRATPAFTVPDGNVFVLRQLAIEMYPNQSSGGAGFDISPFGDMGTPGAGVTTPKLRILVDDVPTNIWTQYGPSGLNGVPLYNAFAGSLVIPTFVIVGPGSTFTIFIPNFIDPAGGTNCNTYVHYYGNMLLASGRDIVQEAANAKPLPVRMGE